MATYEYECPSDGTITAITRGMTEPELEYNCSSCGLVLRRIYSPPPISFKGSGFYSTGG
jgi:putative FmdB family regulatory protein